jgi:hypothetical protein
LAGKKADNLTLSILQKTAPLVDLARIQTYRKRTATTTRPTPPSEFLAEKMLSSIDSYPTQLKDGKFFSYMNKIAIGAEGWNRTDTVLPLSDSKLDMSKAWT